MLYSPPSRMNLKKLCFSNTPKHVTVFTRYRKSSSSPYFVPFSNKHQQKNCRFSYSIKTKYKLFPSFFLGDHRNTPLSRDPLHSNIFRLLNLPQDCQLFFPILSIYYRHKRPKCRVFPAKAPFLPGYLSYANLCSRRKIQLFSYF
jgi:hypothetical protein